VQIISNIVGITGVTLILLMYFLLQAQKINPATPLFSVANIGGALFVMFSLYYHWNLASMLMETVFLSISIYGLARSRKCDLGPDL
jgi:hypothetical protein